MPFDSEGNFTRIHNWEDDRINDIDIVTDHHDEEDDNFADALSSCFLRDGRTAMRGDINCAGFKVKNLGSGTLSGDAVNKSQLESAVSKLETGISGSRMYHVHAAVNGSAVILKPENEIYVVTVSALPFTLSFEESALDSSKYRTFELRIIKNIEGNITWPSSVSWEYGITPDLKATGNYYLVFRKEPGGIKWLGNLQGRWS